MVKLYIRDISELFDGKWREKLDELPSDRKKRAQNMRKDHDSARCVGAWLLLKEAMGAAGFDISSARQAKNEYGKPKFEGAPEFSVSHAGPYAAVAISESPVGVDVESARCTIRIAEKFFTARELDAADALSGDEQLLYLQRLWVCKEAFVKAIGTGLYTPFSSFGVDLTDRGAELMQYLSPLPLKLTEFSLGAFRGAVCGLGPVERV